MRKIDLNLLDYQNFQVDGSLPPTLIVRCPTFVCRERRYQSHPGRHFLLITKKGPPGEPDGPDC